MLVRSLRAFFPDDHDVHQKVSPGVKATSVNANKGKRVLV